MSHAAPHSPDPQQPGVREPRQPDALPVRPGEGLPPAMPAHPQPDRIAEPVDGPGREPQRSGRHAEVGVPAHGAKAPHSSTGLPLPHERDESVSATAAAPDVLMVQATLDLDAGLVDTDMRATPGLDAERRAHLVPGAAGQQPVRAA